MKAKNEFRMTVDSRSVNEAFVRSTVAAFSSQLDPTIEEIDREIMLRKPEVLKIDFDGVTFMDSSGIGLVMGRYRTLALSGGRLIVSNLSNQFYKIMKLSGLEKIATINKKESSYESKK